MRSFPFSACLLSALLCGASAHAENGAANSVSYSWTGLYGGINAGYGWQNSDWDFAGGGSNSHNDSEGVVGLQFGYDAQLSDHWFGGIEAELDASRIDGQSACLAGKSCETHVSSLGDVAARVGITSGQSLFYVKGGIAYEDATHHILVPGVSDNGDGGGAVFGYVVGGGVEYALTYNLTAKIEYNYLDFGSKDSTVTPNTNISVKEPINLVKVGMNMKFD